MGWPSAFSPLPSERGAGGEGGQPRRSNLVLASADGVRSQSVPFLIHPELLRIYIAKQALNFVRLALLA